MNILDEAIYHDELRQQHRIILNAALSECPLNVRQAISSNFVNVDAEGYVPQWLANITLSNATYDDIMELYKIYRDKRANKCCENFNIVEKIACEYLSKCFENDIVNSSNIYVNVQPPTGAIANLIAVLSFANDGDRILSMDLSHGGHLSHGSSLHYVGKKFIIDSYGTTETGEIDYNEIHCLLQKHPQILIAGASSYPKYIDWKKIRELIDAVSPTTIFLADIAHIAGLVCGKVFPSPFGYADVVTMVSYKTFCGSRSAAIFSFSKENAEKIKRTCFPYFIGSPLAHQIAGLAKSAENALKPEFSLLQERIVKNAQTFERVLLENGLKTKFQGTQTHIVILDLKSSQLNLTGEEAANLLEDNNIMVNKNILPGDKKNSDASGIRFGFTWTAQKNYTDNNIIQLANTIVSILKNGNTMNC